MQEAMEGVATFRLAWELPALVGRYERRVENYLGFVRLGCVMILLSSTQAVLNRRFARSVPTATAVACLHFVLCPPLLRVSAMASSRDSTWPLTHAAANASSPSALRASATVRLCPGRKH